jgi:predicted outer membrane repeat protein
MGTLTLTVKLSNWRLPVPRAYLLTVYLLLMTAISAIPLHAAAPKVVYVSTIGNDTDSGATVALAKETVQAGITAAGSGGTVYLEPGSYVGPGNSNIGFGGQNIIVRSDPANGGSPANTNIDLGGSPGDDAFLFIQGETSAAQLIGLTIENGSRPGGRGGAIIISAGSSPTIRDCDFRNNQALYGGAIAVVDSSPIIRECTFTGNKVVPVQGDSEPAAGGAIDFMLDPAATGSVDPIVTNCVFQSNFAYTDGGAIDISGDLVPLSPAITNCTFYQNISSGPGRPGGAIGIYGATPIITNCVLWADVGGEIVYVTNPPPPNGASATVSHCVIEQAGFSGSGYINKDPKLTSYLRPQANSPCNQAGIPNVPTGVDITIDRSGETRGSMPAIGSYEPQLKASNK